MKKLLILSSGLAIILIILAACGGSAYNPPDIPSLQGTDATQPVDKEGGQAGSGSGGGGDSGGEGDLLGGDEEEVDPFDYPPLEEWTEPEFGRTVMIASDCVIVALEGTWEQSVEEELPIDIAPLDEAFENHPAIQNLIASGYELVVTWGEVNGGLFKLPEGVSVSEAIAQITVSPEIYPDVWKVYPDAVYEWCVEPTDPDFDDQWNFHNNIYNYDVDGPEGWNYETGSYSTIVAVMDTGVVRACFPNRVTDWGANVGRRYYSWRWHGGQPLVGSPDWQHGTAVASVIAAPTNDGKDICGGMWTCQVFPVRMRVFYTSSVYHAYRVIAATKGIFWDSRFGNPLRPPVVYNGMKAVNYSGGGYTPHFLGMKFIYRYLGAHTVFVCAAGNEATWHPFFPAGNSYYTPWHMPDLTLGVGAHDEFGWLMYIPSTGEGSNYGRWNCDLAAPGVNVPAFWPSSLNAYDVEEIWGTSIASPHVAALAGLRATLYPDERAITALNRVQYNSRKTYPPLHSYYSLQGQLMPVQCSYYNCLSFYW